jgi:heat shock protein HtpX
MRRKALGRDPGLTFRMLVVVLLVVLTYGGLIYLLWLAAKVYPVFWLGIPALVALALFSQQLGLGLGGARIIGPRDEVHLQTLVERLCAITDLPKPRIALLDTGMPNAFTIGWSQRGAVLVLTRGLLARLDERELEAVIAHELSHIANRDSIVMTGAGFVPLVGNALYNVLPLLGPIAALIYGIGTSLTVTLSRYREFAADRGSAIMTGAPEHLMSALQKISDEIALIPRSDMRAVDGLNAFLIVSNRPRRFAWASGHPPLEKRLKQLAEIARAMGKVPT